MSQCYRILMLEDDPEDAELMARELEAGGLNFELKRASGKESFVNLLDSFKPDIILSDYHVPGFDGLAALETVRVNPQYSALPFILVSGVLGEDLAVAALKAGATDFVLKERLSRLLPALRHALSEYEVRAGLKAIELEAINLFKSRRTGCLPPVEYADMEARILILEDDPVDAEITVACLYDLGRKATFRIVDNKEDFLRALPEFKPDVVIADYHVPGFQGNESLCAVEELCPGVPFVLISGVVGEEVAIEAVKAGAADYVLKDRLSRLPFVVRRALLEAYERKQLSAARKTVAESAEEISERSHLASLSAAVGAALNAGDTIYHMLHGCTEALVQYLDLSSARIWTVDLLDDSLVMLAESGPPLEAACDKAAVLPGKTLIGRIAARRQPYLVPAISAAPEEIADTLLCGSDSVVSFAAYPLLVGDHLMGVLALCCRRQLTPQSAAALSAVADHIALGIRRKNSEQELRVRSEQQAAVAELGRKALEGMEPVALMDLTVAILCDVLGVEFGKVLELQRGERFFLLRAGAGWKPDLVGRALVPAGLNSQAGYTLASGHPVVVEDLSCDERFAGPALLREHGITSGVSAVIRGKSAPFGVLGAHTARRRHFSRDDVNFVQALANVLAASVERKAAEDMLLKAAESERNAVRQMVEHAPVCIARLSDSFAVMEANDVFCESAGLSQEQIAGKSLPVLMPDLPEQIMAEVLQTGLARGLPAYPLIVESPAGKQERYFDITLWPVKGPVKEEDSVQGLIMHMIDISEKVILAHHREVFAQTMAHDMKAPLIGADRALEALLAGKTGLLNSEQEELLSALQESNRHVLGMVRNLLEISRYRGGMQVLVPSEVSLPALVADCLAQLNVTFKNRHVQICNNVPSGLAPLFADSLALQHLLMNLLENAVKFSPPGSSVEISARDEGGSVAISVRDSGPGISLSDQKRLFKRFWQGELGKSAASGSGLGLYLCHQIALAHGGSISCSSRPGEGALFTVTLPLLHAQETEAATSR